MRLAMKMPPKKGAGQDNAANDMRDDDPRESGSAEVIDLASRSVLPAVAGKKSGGDAMGMVAGIAIVAALGLVTLWSMSSARLDTGETAPATDAAPVSDTSPAQVTVDPAPSSTTVVTSPPQQVVRADPAPSPIFSNNPNVAPGTAANPYNSPTIVFDASGKAVATVPTAALPEGAGSSGAQGATGNAAGDFASRVGGVGGTTAQAKAMTNPATTVTQGTLIPAILETAIDTDVPGYVRAVVSQDVKSFNGKNVLIPRSSRLIGQYQSGLQAGQKRAYVIWTRVIRPDGASVNLQSPGIGFDGTTGLPGDVDSRFFQRFGSAMLLSVVGGLSAIGTGGASVVIGGGGQAAAAAAAQQDGQLGPVVRVRQGEPIRVFTARDLDFSGV